MSAETVNKYYNSDLNFTQKVTEQEILNGKNLSKKHIETLCNGFLTNAIYANVVEGGKTFEQGREESFEIAAQVVLEHGRAIKNQLDENDKKAAQKNSALDKENNAEAQQSSDQNQPNTSDDIQKISGGTMTQIITKITEVMASMSPQERDSAAANFSAVFEALGSSFDKIKQTIQGLAGEPTVVADIKNTLKETEGGKIFDKLLDEHLNTDQVKVIEQVSKKDLDERRGEIAEQRKNQTGLGL